MPSKPKSYKYNQLDFLINEASKKDKFIVIFPDTYIEKIFTDLYIENLSKNDSKCIKKSCTEISIDWAENNLLSYDMFSSDEQYLFFELDKLKKKQIDQLEGVDEELRKKLVKFRDDEVEHKNTAIDEGSREAFGYSVLRKTINETTKAAIFLAERI